MSDDEIKFSWSTCDLEKLQQVCGEAATHLAHGLAADRTLIVCKTDGEYLIQGGKAGFAKFALYHNAPVSLTVLEDAALRGRTALSGHAMEDHETQQTLTLQLSGAVSMICVPLLDKQGNAVGALYGDTVSRENAFRHNQLRYMREMATWLSRKLTGVEDAPPPKPRKKERLKASSVDPSSEEDDEEKLGLVGHVTDLIGRFERFIYYS